MNCAHSSSFKRPVVRSQWVRSSPARKETARFSRDPGNIRGSLRVLPSESEWIDDGFRYREERAMTVQRFVPAAVVSLMAAAASLPAQSAGDAARGATVYESLCAGCHALVENRVAPAHRGVFGRKAGSAPDYDYSEALASSK